MATNFIQDGKIIDFTAGANYDSGDPVLIGQIFGVCQTDIDSGDVGSAEIEGIYELTKATGITIIIGQLLYWDAAASKITNVAASNKFVGFAIEAAGSSATKVKIKIMNSFGDTKSNYAATGDPGVGDDSADGYVVGSIWINTTLDKVFICVDNALGAAVWAQVISDAERSKLVGIEALADVTDATNVSAAGAVMHTEFTVDGFLHKDLATGAILVKKTNFDSVAAPMAVDDNTAGYVVGSIWTQPTTGKAWISLDATTGAAVWGQLAEKNNYDVAVAPTVTDDNTAGYAIGSIWCDNVADNIYFCIDARTGAAVWLELVTNAERLKLSGIEALADVTDATNVAAAGAVMDSDITPVEGIIRKTGAGAYTAHKSNLASAVAPTVNDDDAAGYSVGSLWCDTTADIVYVCIDASTGAAIWHQMVTAAERSKLSGIEALADVTDATNVAAAGAVMDSDIAPTEGILRKTGAGAYTAHKSNLAAAVAPIVTDDDAAGYSVGSLWIDTTADDVYQCVDASTGAAAWRQMVTPTEKTRISNIGAAKLFVEAYTCIAGDDTAGLKDIDTGFGVAPDVFHVQILRAGVDVKDDAIVTALGGGDAGKIRIADGGITYAITANDVIHLVAYDKV